MAAYHLVRVVRSDGTVICFQQGGAATNVSDIAIDSPGAGTFSYFLQALRFVDGTASSQSSVYRRTLVGLVLKR